MTEPASPEPPLIVTELTDPGCVWSWASEPKVRWLRRQLDGQATWRRVLGISHDDMYASRENFDPVRSIPEIEAGWQGVAEKTGAPHAHALQQVFRSTRPAATAAKAAEHQGADVADRVLRRLREAIFAFGGSPDDPASIRAALAGVPGLDLDRLEADARSSEVTDAIDHDFDWVRRPAPDAVELDGPGPHPGQVKKDGDWVRYVFPTLIFGRADRADGADGAGGAGPEPVAVTGWRSLDEYVAAVGAVAPEVRLDRAAADPGLALSDHGTLTRPELELLTGGVDEPPEAVRLDLFNGPLYLHPSEAAARGLQSVSGGTTW